MPSGKPYEPHVKAAAIAALMAGESPRVVADSHGLPLSTVRKWGVETRRDNLIVRPEKKAELGELVHGYLEDLLATVAAQARFARDESWLRQQNAGDLAILHGVLVDKAVRILAALEPADGDIAV